MKRTILQFNIKQLGLTFSLLFLALFISAQQTVTVTVSSISTTLNDTGCDGFLTGDEDALWAISAQDSPDVDGNGFPLGFAYEQIISGDGAIPNQNPDGSQNPFFTATYNACVPTNLLFEWKGCEDDGGLGATNCDSDGSGTDGTQNESVPMVTGSYTFEGFGQNGPGGSSCSDADFTVTVDVVVNGAPSLGPVADNICSAEVLTIDGPTQSYAWCADQTLEANEPTFSPGTTDVTVGGTAWFSFVAPTGAIFIDTDPDGNTQIGTEFIVYHAANGNACDGVNACDGTVLKNKFQYLSYVDGANADLGGPVSLSSQADLELDCNDVLAGANGLIPGEVYYIAVSSDDAGELGQLDIRITSSDSDVASSRPTFDIPCGAFDADAFVTTTASTNAANAEDFDLDTSCAFDDEVQQDDPHAYDLSSVDPSEEIAESSVWFSFTAPNSGRISIEANCNLQGEQIALLSFDPAFGPATPTTYSCVDLMPLAFSSGGALGGDIAEIDASCLEPGFTYYVVADEPSLASCDPDIWIYDPSVASPTSHPTCVDNTVCQQLGPSGNALGNDIMCLALADANFEVPVNAIGACGTASLAGDNTNACIESLAGEPSSGAAQTTWHYFTVPASGAVEIGIAAGTIPLANFNVYNTTDGTTAGCYGGLADTGNGRTFVDGSCAPLVPCISGNSSSDPVQKCCLTPGEILAIQVDGAAVGNMGTYTLTINEIDVDAGNTSYVDPDGATIDGTTADPTTGEAPAIICYTESLTAATDAITCPLTSYCAATCSYPDCLDIGYVIHNAADPNPSDGSIDPTVLAGLTVYGTLTPGVTSLTNDGSSAIPSNTVVYISAVADDETDWGSFCASVDIHDAAPLVFLDEIVPSATTLTTDASCVIPDVSVTGGLPGFDSSDFTYELRDGSGGLVNSGTIAAGTPLSGLTVSTGGTYTLTFIDNEGCSVDVAIDATACFTCAPSSGSWNH